MLPIILFASVFIVIFKFDKGCDSVGELKKEARRKQIAQRTQKESPQENLEGFLFHYAACGC